MNNHIQKVLLVVALDMEAEPIITKLGLHQRSQSFVGLPMKSYDGKYNKLDIFLITSGRDPIHKVQNIGTQPATLSTYLGISNFHPDLIVNVGTAGGITENGAKIGDVYASQKIYFFDRRMPLAGYAEYGSGGYQSFNTDVITKKIGLKQGIICSGDSFDENEIDYKIILQHGCAAKEMESAGVAWVSMLTKTPMFAIKGITDIVGSKDGHDQFKKNVSTVTEKLSEKLLEFLGYLVANTTN